MMVGRREREREREKERERERERERETLNRVSRESSVLYFVSVGYWIWTREHVCMCVCMKLIKIKRQVLCTAYIYINILYKYLQ